MSIVENPEKSLEGLGKAPAIYLIVHHILNLMFVKFTRHRFKFKFNLWGNSHKMVSYQRVYKKFKEFYMNSGIKKNELGLHSFRSGFHCSALINARSKKYPIDVIRQLTMLIADWKKLEDQRVYEKRQVNNILSMSNLLDTGLNSSTNVIIAAEILTPHVLLGYKDELKNLWKYPNASENLTKFKSYIKVLFQTNQNFWNYAMNKYGMENILNKFGSEEETKLNLPTLKLAFSNYYDEFKKFMPKGDISSQAIVK